MIKLVELCGFANTNGSRNWEGDGNTMKAVTTVTNLFVTEAETSQRPNRAMKSKLLSSGVLAYCDRWWIAGGSGPAANPTAPVVFLAALAAAVIGILAARSQKRRLCNKYHPDIPTA